MAIDANGMKTWLGPEIEAIGGDDSTSLELMKIVRAGLQADKDHPIALKIEVSDADLAKAPLKSMHLKKIPAVIALYYLAECTRYQLVCRNGLWVFRAYGSKSATDDYRFIVEPVTDEQLAALGLRVGADGKVTVIDGPRWPTDEQFGKISRDGENLLVTASGAEVTNLKALLALKQAGYAIPKINSAVVRPDGN